MSYFKNKSILITGGTGSFGKNFVNQIIKKHKDVKRLVIFSRDELKQSMMLEDYPKDKYPNLRFFLGDLRDKERIHGAMDGIDIVVHAAALKHVPTAEYNPFEFVKTNIIGAQNLIEACLDNKPKNVIAISTDKAVSPINLYGATKLASDKLFLAANNIKGKRDTKFSIARYGNVMASRGSVIPFFIEQRKKGYLPITDLKMTRFNISISQAVKFVMWALEKNIGGEIFIPKCPSYKITDLAKAIDNQAKIKITGIRPGEKIEEELLSKAENNKTVDLGKCYVVVGTTNDKTEKYYSGKKFKKVKKDFSYSSGTNEKFLSVKDLKDLIKRNFLNIKNK